MALVCCLGVLVLTPDLVRADTAALPDQGYSPLQLTQTDVRYPLASLAHSSGFAPVLADQRLENAMTYAASQQTYSLEPDFKRHGSYWLYTEVTNDTANRKWVLHVSNFGFLRPRVLINGPDGQRIKTFQQDDSADINTIGRAVEVTLEPGESYSMVIELTAQEYGWYPYIALMSESRYQVWKTQMDFAFKPAIGIIIGMVLLGFLCWLVMADNTFFWGAFSSLVMLFYYLEHSSLPELFWQYDYQKNALFWLLISVNVLSLLAFAASFLQINRRSGWWYHVFVSVAVISVLVLVVGYFTSFITKSFLYAFNYTLLWTVILSSGVAKVCSEGRYYFIYIFGWLPMVLSTAQVILFVLLPARPVQEVMPSYKLIYVLYVQILHMMIHAVALIMRVKVMRQKKIEAEFISQAKSRFIAQSSHDLRQPLHTMRLFLQSLQPYVRSPEAQPIFAGLNKTHQQMNDSFSAIMDLSKLEAGVMKAEIKAVSLKDVFSRLHNDYQWLAKEKNLRFAIHPCSLTVLTDPLLLERMLRNLLSNAIKYTNEGRVVLGCRRRAQSVAIQVLDTGTGISHEDQTHIFDIYQRSAVEQDGVDGAGIGLSVVKHLSVLMDHPLELSSVVGSGSIFTALVPRATHATEAESQPHKRLPRVARLTQLTDEDDSIGGWLGKHNGSVQSFSSLATFYQSDMTFELLIGDAQLMMDESWSMAAKNRLAEQYVVACVCDSGTELPTGWVALSQPVLPTQLRALLNYAERRYQSQLNNTTPSPQENVAGRVSSHGAQSVLPMTLSESKT
ncbi:sensor histidine kinase [Gynuella sunshinyii]|uniref:histidine kinase n=1 Tax=Gynuella sunshinyii YC6258 TaxID=1445510 RepID=A0A0C5UZ61_9GAMM|nr:sensor histidine kinase [Gynuella sunshinyii]AJQ92620.1 signal transduction histidine kinase [Gynuella sunshinyii YC6258]